VTAYDSTVIWFGATSGLKAMSLDAAGWRIGRSIPLLSQLESLWSIVSSSSRVQGRALVEIEIL